MSNVKNIPDSPELTANSKRIGELWAKHIQSVRAVQADTLKICELLLDTRRRLTDKEFDEWFDRLNIHISMNNLTENDHE